VGGRRRRLVFPLVVTPAPSELAKTSANGSCAAVAAGHGAARDDRLPLLQSGPPTRDSLDEDEERDEIAAAVYPTFGTAGKRASP